MATKILSVRVNGEVKNYKENTLEALKGIITTQNPASKTVHNAVTLCGGVGYVDLIRKNGHPGDVVEVYEDSNLIGRGKRANIAEKMLICLNAEKWVTESFSEKKSPAEKEASPVETF